MTIASAMASAAVVAAALVAPVLSASAPASADANIPLVSDHASDLMPAIPGSACSSGETGSCRRVNVIAQIGGWVYVGGIISSVIDRSSGTDVTINGFHNLFRFNPATGAVDRGFQPQFYRSSQTDYTDSIVTGLAGNSTTVYVAGKFTQFAPSSGAAGTTRKGVAAVNANTGALVSTFNAHVCQGGGGCQVDNLNLVQGALWLAGGFSHLASHAQAALAFVDPGTGALRAGQLSISGQVTTTTATKVAQAAINPQQTQAVIIGNFTSVGGATRDDVAVLNLNGSGGATLNAWNDPTNLAASAANCRGTDTWARGVDWDPTGTYFDIAASGGGGFNAFGNYGALCDAFSRFKSDSNPNTPYPLIVNLTGFDSLFTVQDTGNVAYTGGHNKSLNHAVYINGKKVAATQEDHYGLGAIDVKPGDPGYGKAITSWNNTTSTGRGEGWKGSLTTSAGLWMGGDSPTVNGDKTIQRLAFFPVS
jgi:hypothetical protein